MQLELDLGLTDQDLKMEKVRGFEVVSRCSSDTVLMPRRATKLAAGYDIFNNTGKDIVLQPGDLSEAFTTKIKAYMLNDEYLAIYPRSGHGFKYSVRLANSVGIIDSDFYNNEKSEGEIFIKFHNQGNSELIIKQGEAFAQAIFTKYFLVDGDDYTQGIDRNGGFGSTTGK